LPSATADAAAAPDAVISEIEIAHICSDTGTARCADLCLRENTAFACHEMASQLEFQDPTKARFFAERACSMGSSFGCATAARILLRDQTAAGSKSRAESLSERACALGDSESCKQAASLLRSQAFSVDDPGGDRLLKAEVLYMRGGVPRDAVAVAGYRISKLCQKGLTAKQEACFEAMREFRSVAKIGTTAIEEDLRTYTRWVNHICARVTFEDCGKFRPLPEPETCYERTGNGDCPDAPTTDADAGP
jgi:TPR repeat protein